MSNTSMKVNLYEIFFLAILIVIQISICIVLGENNYDFVKLHTTLLEIE